jgi:hypothetical protein
VTLVAQEEKLRQQALQSQDRFIAKVREIARECGYAVGVHGSRKRDLDLIAVPWTERAIAPQHLVEALLERLPNLKLKPHPEPELLTNPTRKPNGRIAWAIIGAPACQYLDLSVFA